MVNITPFETKYSLMKSTQAAHLAPVAIQVAALHHRTIWLVLAAVVLCVALPLSAGFRFLWSNVPFFRHSITWTAAIQLIAFALSVLMSANWPMVTGVVAALTLTVLCLIYGLNVVAKQYNIPE
jgi:hypothetical protein